MGRQPCCDKIGLKRGPWTMEKDQKLINFIMNNGIHCWHLVPKLAGLMPCRKSGRLRWTNYLQPDLKRGAFSEDEENQIIQLHSCLGNRWSRIASYFPSRTNNEVKSHWNTRVKKRLKLLGLDPATDKAIEHLAKYDSSRSDYVAESNPSEVQEKSVEIMDIVSSSQEEHLMNDEKVLFGSNNMIVLHDGMPWENLDVEELKPQANPSSSSCTSFPIDDTSPEGSKLCLFYNTDTFPSWKALHPLEDVFPHVNFP